MSRFRMKISARSLRQRGVVLIAVLWCCSIIMWFSFQISAKTRLAGEERIHAIRQSHALYLAIGGCYEAIARMGQQQPVLPFGRSSMLSWQPDGRPRVVEYKSGIAVVIVEPEEMKINVNTAPPQLLAEVIQMAGADQISAEILADRILDFNHPGDVPRPRGMKQDAYLRAGLNYVPFCGPLTSLEQLLLVPGVSPQLFYGYDRWKDQNMRELPEILRDIQVPWRNSLFSLLTIYGNNVNLPQEIINEQQQELMNKLMTWRSGGIYRILSFGKSAGGPPSVGICLTVSYGAAAGNAQPYQILSRKVM
jgi:general secretion pathway protein K